MSKTVLITGASSGFGEACAKRYAEHAARHDTPACRLILLARNVDKLEQLQQRLAGEHCQVYVAGLDVRNSADIEAVVAKLPAAFSDVDILINNAGLALGMAPADQASIDDWDTMVDTNIKGLIRMTHCLLPGMVQRNRGHIVNVGSIAGSWPYPGGNTYCASKAFVQQFSRALRADLLGKAIRVTNIDPGMAETRFSNVRMHGDDDKAAAVYQDTQPLSADDIADIIYWTTSVPAHININTLEVMPTCQAWGPLAVDRTMTTD